jgi:hypothetical protein
VPSLSQENRPQTKIPNIPKGSAAMTQPTEHEDEFNEILAAAYAALMQMPVKPETYEQYVRSEMADHQYKEPSYRK